MCFLDKYVADHEIQKNINQLKTTANKEGFMEMDASFDALKISLQESKLKLINDFKSDIIPILEGEIIKRYFYRDGMYAYFIKTNSEVFEALKIMNDQNKYQDILK